MAMVHDDTRQQLHQLLDKMLDGGLEVGTLSKATAGDGKLEIEEYRLVLHKKVKVF